MLEMMLKSINKKKSNQKGFTLVELIVVVAILGILAAVAIPKIGGFGNSAKDQAAHAEHKMLVSAIQMYQSEEGTDKFPTALTDLDAYIDGGTTKLSATHAIADSELTTTSKGDTTKTWTYPQ